MLIVALLGERTPLVGARRTRGVGEDTNGPLKAPRVDTKLAPQALDLLDDEPRMIKNETPRRSRVRKSIPSFCCIQQMRAMPWRPAMIAADAPGYHLAADDAACPQILMKKSSDWSRYTLWRERMRRRLMVVFAPYRPELHYMRGRGPKWREKHASPAR